MDGEPSMRLVTLLLLSTALAAADVARARAETLSCYGKQQPKQVAELLFGRDVGGKLGVGEAAWARFVTRQITPRFPDGLTVTDAAGQWRDPSNGTIVREPAKRVEIVLPGNADDEAQLDAIVGAYKQKFHQRSVGIIVRTACVAF
jgi:uncharacterized protein DUF3574